MSQFLARHRRNVYKAILKVNHSGELGADRIYAGQMYVFRNDPQYAPMLQHMWDQEKKHLEYFSKQILYKRTSKSMLYPIWDVAGTILGVSTALMGKSAAMACTVAVEDTISKHYDGQIRTLLNDDLGEHQQFIEKISKIRDEELEHHDIGLQNDAKNAPGYDLLTGVITNGCKLAIALAQRI